MWSTLLKKVLNIGKAKSNQELDQVEDPVEMIKLATVELEQIIAKATQTFATATDNQMKLEKEHHQFRTESLSWYQKAAAALKAGNEEQAQKYLAKKALADKKEAAYRDLLEAATSTAMQLQEQLDDYKIKLEEIKTKQSIYAAKAESAKAQKQIAESLGGLNGSALANMGKYEEAIDQLQAEAESLMEINGDSDRIDKELKQLANKSDIQSDMDQMRLDMKRKAHLKEQQKLLEIKQKFEELAKSTNTNQIKPVPPPPKEVPTSNAENSQLKEKPATLDDIKKKFEELDNSTNTREIKAKPAPTTSSKDDLAKKMDDFFKKK